MVLWCLIPLSIILFRYFIAVHTYVYQNDIQLISSLNRLKISATFNIAGMPERSFHAILKYGAHLEAEF